MSILRLFGAIFTYQGTDTGLIGYMTKHGRLMMGHIDGQTVHT